MAAPGRHLVQNWRMAYVLAIHGGAGVIRAGAQQDVYHLALADALAVGEAVLVRGGGALDAVLAAVVALENCPLFNAGRGAVLTSDSTHELDAAVMCGAGLRAGAVAGVRRVRNPVLAAHQVLADGRYVLLGGEGADRYAADAGLAMVENGYFFTALRKAQLAAVRAARPADAVLDHSGEPVGPVIATDIASDIASDLASDLASDIAPGRAAPDSTRFGTVGAVALDRGGHLAAATSTGGMTNKLPGRIGDTPLVGAGVYANDSTCAVSATGTGEHFIRACIAHDVHARIAYGGASLPDAAGAAIAGSLAALGGEGGIIALGRDGQLAMPFTTRGMYRGWVREGEALQTRIFGEA